MPVGTYPIEDLAVWLDGELPDGINVYGHAADIGKLPALVMAPGNPAIALRTMAGGNLTLAWGIDATLVVSRSQTKYGTRALVDMWRQVAVTVQRYSETVTVMTLEEIGEVEWSGGTAMAGTMPLVLEQNEGT